MTRDFKIALMTLLAALGTFLGFLVSYIGGTGPVPLPSHSPASIPSTSDWPKVLQKLERPEYATDSDWGTEATRFIPRGGTAGFIVDLGPDSGAWCADRRGAIDTSTASGDPLGPIGVLLPVRVSTPSYDGGKTGAFVDPIVPVNSVSCALSRFRWVESSPTISQVLKYDPQLKLSVVVEDRDPDGFAMLVGLSQSYLYQGHCGQYCSREAELAAKYQALFDAHRLIPLDHDVVFPPVKNGLLDLDAGGAVSFRHVVLEHARPGWLEFPPAWKYADPAAYLKALQATIDAQSLGRPFVFVRDEPTDLDRLGVELTQYRALAPSVRTLVTTPYSAKLDGLVDHFVPVINRLGRQGYPGATAYAGKQWGAYASCQDSCGPIRADQPTAARTPGPDTGLPDFLIDRPSANISGFFSELRGSGATLALYYSAVEGFRLFPSIDVFKDPWNFGGNGDGLLAYPGRPGEWGLSEHTALPSLRMKFLRAAIEGVR